MKWLNSFIIVLLMVLPLRAELRFEDHFEFRSMRIDLFHSGNAQSEQFAIDEVKNDGPWAGSTRQLLDPIDLGLYRVVVLDQSARTELYRDGYASIFGEWQTIPEAQSQWGTFHESLRIPWPKAPVTLRIDKRDAENRFQPIWQRPLDPAYRQVNPTAPTSRLNAFKIWGEEEPSRRLDIVVLGDGYSEKEMDKFRADAQRLSSVLLDAEPYRSLKDKITIRAVETPSRESGITRPHIGLYRNTALSVRYSAFDSERYALTMDNQRVRDAAATVPYEFTLILINERTYGGGGIYKLYATVAADNAFADYIVIHEMGHHLAALADEYYTSSVAYDTSAPIRVEPWEKNVTAYLDKQPKWSHLIKRGTPLPTPWDKSAFEEFGQSIEARRSEIRAKLEPESKMEALFTEQRENEQALFAKMRYRNRVGLFEGANYRANGYFRSSINCIMFTRSLGFCPVCQETIAQVIDQHSR